jgi:putative two-component system response regulator
VSVGLASFPGDATTRHYLIEKAQEALVRAKLGGKNKVVLFEREAPPLDHRPTVLAVDDERLNLEIVEAILAPCNYKIVKTSHPEEALSLLQRMDIDLILLDVVMPGMDGYELCRRVKGQEGTRLIPVVLLTGLDDQEAKIKGIEAGADDFVVKPPNHTELIARTNSLIRVKALNHSLIGIENVLFSLARTVEAKDIYTRGHISRTSQLAVLLGKRLGMGRKDIDALRFGAMLHDIGKIGVPMEVLNKPGPLDSGEFEIIRNHPLVGYEICLPLKKTLGKALQVIRHHHEKLDGSGYPDGLRGEEIPFMTRIMAVVDVYDALVTDRPYRKAFAPEKAVAILREDCMRGKLDSQILEELIRALSPPAHAP